MSFSMKHSRIYRLAVYFAASLCFVLAASHEAAAQSMTVSGTVSGTNGPEIGVVVSVVGGGYEYHN